MKTLAYKDNKIVYSNLVMLLVYLIGIGLAVWRFIGRFDSSSIMLKIIFGGVTLVLLYLFIDDLIKLIKNIRIPKELIKADEEYLYICSSKEIIKMPLIDIFRIEKPENNDTRFLFFYTYLIIRYDNKPYKVEGIKDIDKVYSELCNLLKEVKNEEDN